MTRDLLQKTLLPALAAILLTAGVALPGGVLEDGTMVPVLIGGQPIFGAVVGLIGLWTAWRFQPKNGALVGACAIIAGLLIGLELLTSVRTGIVITPAPLMALSLMIVAFALIWQGMAVWSAMPDRWTRLAVPLLFGGLLVFAWEVLVTGFDVPVILLPPPSMILEALLSDLPTFAVDFNQTVIRAALPGYIAGCGIGFLAAVAIDRSPFLQRGLLPIGSLVSAMPIVGIAPIMVMWFGFDWHSKAAVVIVMTFFPMLVNTLAGLQAAGSMERDLMRSYAASYGQTLGKLRLPGALPFIFNALKLNSTLALIGAIVAEFFGTPIYGMGFRISTEVGRLNVDMVWATIVVAAIAGSAFYGGLALLERWATFWHPSQRVRG